MMMINDERVRVPNPRFKDGSPPPGMTLRDYFAAHALAGLAGKYPSFPEGDLTRGAYVLADAMLEARAEEG